jgi:hypothetical protein
MPCRADAGLPLTMTAPVRSGRAAVPGQGDRDGSAHRRGAHHLRRVGRAHPPPGHRARHARHLRRRPGRHVLVEHVAPPRAVLRRAVHRPGAAHAQPPAVPRAGHLHREPRRGRGDLRRQDSWPACCGRCSTFTTVRHVVVIDDGGPFDTSQVPDGMQLHDYETLLAGRLARRVAGDRRREPGRVDVLHERHHRQPQGRGVQPPSARCCTPWRHVRRRGRASGSPTIILPVVPMFHANAWGLAHAAVAPAPTWSCPGPICAGAAGRPHREERVTVAAGVPTIWMGVLPELQGRDTSRCASSRAVARRCPRRSARGSASRSACPSSRPGA